MGAFEFCLIILTFHTRLAISSKSSGVLLPYHPFIAMTQTQTSLFLSH